MQCPNCNSAITPGMEIKLEFEGGEIQRLHCPYCLWSLQATPASGGPGVSVDRFTSRREVRQRFVEQLLAGSSDDQVRCPLCDYQLNRNSLVALKSSEHFICPQCARDIAYEAYRQEAYSEQPWRSLVMALADMKGQTKCVNCRYLGAAARSCQVALSWIPGEHSKQDKMLASMVRHPDQDLPDDGDCYSSCPVIQHYRQEVAKRLQLL